MEGQQLDPFGRDSLFRGIVFLPTPLIRVQTPCWFLSPKLLYPIEKGVSKWQKTVLGATAEVNATCFRNVKDLST